MRYAIIEPILKINNFELQLSNFNFFILVFSTVLLTAAGYVINDYFDTKTDILNRPDSVVVGRKIGRRTAMTIHLIFNIIAIIGGFYISYKIGLYQLGFIFFLVSGILWYYSTSYKRQFLIGNLIVAILTGLVPLMVILFEMPVLNKEYYEILLAKKANFNHVFFWVAGFSFFAFITTLIREIVKDMQDYEGDSAYGRNTLPIILGIFYTKLVVSILIILTLISLAYVYFKFLIGSDLTLWYIIIGEISPLLFISFKLITAKNKDDYKFISTLLKIIMLIGILYSLVEAYIFTYNF
ncbi:MAG: geranylgeranylglycerol-phosphate geranylgeranyltransferase [Bacteroidales bacterium]|nr:geranylgeranylglycerol-phosphate geranylgeranyltransferase [Bacteroidales bacterium]